MANVTLTIDEDVLKRARIRALEQGTSVNAVVRDFLRAYAATEPVRRAVDELMAISARATWGSRGQARTWTREDLHAR